jgi:shikimate dehydrogenase
LSPGLRFALIGDPVGHSVSPAMHRAAFAAAGIPGAEYVALTVTRPGLADAWPRLRERFAGLNVTTPLKEVVLDLLDDVHDDAAACGSVNTIVLRDGRAEGHSTDGEGFLAALRRADPPAPNRVEHPRGLVLGAGGAARAVVAALLRAGHPVDVWARRPEAALAVAAALGSLGPMAVSTSLERSVPEAGVVVNATPVGGQSLPGSPIPDHVRLREGCVVTDLVYRPVRTPLLRRAAAEGCVVVPGVEILIEQGARSFELWTDRPAPAEPMRQAAWSALETAHPEEHRCCAS